MFSFLFKGTQTDAPRLAVALILSALFFLSLQDGLVKFASDSTSLWQFQTLRSVANLGIIFVGLAVTQTWALIRPNNLLPVIMRSIALMFTMMFFFAGAPFLSLPEMGAGLYTYPIFMTLLSSIVLGEKIGRWRLLAIIYAAIGAFLIFRPTAHGFHPAQILPVLAGFFYSVNATILRKYCRGESPITMAIWAGFGFMTVGVVGVLIVSALPLEAGTREAWPFLLTGWPSLVGIVVVLAGVTAICNVTGNVLIVKAYQSAELSGIASIDYSYLIFATFWGWVMFSDFPDFQTALGMIFIGAAGVLTVFRQQPDAKTKATPTTHEL